MHAFPRKTRATLLLLAVALAACAPRTTTREISREKAIEIARQQVKFEIKTTEAEKAAEEGRPVWRITFHGEPIGPSNPIGEVMFVVIDRVTGEVVSLGMS
jgi:Zn-dependent metalloprotease